MTFLGAPRGAKKHKKCKLVRGRRVGTVKNAKVIGVSMAIFYYRAFYKEVRT